jgi:hypothetical protein
MLEKTCPFKYIPMMLWQKKTQFFWKNRNVVSCRLIRIGIIVGFKEDFKRRSFRKKKKANLTFYLG